MKKQMILIYIFAFSFFSLVLGQVQNPERLDARWQTDTSIRSVELDEFIALLPRDHFPVINDPQFEGKEVGEKMFIAHEPVIAVSIDREARAYPLNILTYHEIASDKIGEIPVLVTYCPLCNSGIVYDRRMLHKGKTSVFDFAVSGMLRKSDMVMWDKQTESWWQQLTGEAIVGELTGRKLAVLPSQILSVETFFSVYPAGKILSRNTGFSDYADHYGKNPYANYDDIKNKPKRFFQEESDPRLPPMTRIVDVASAGKLKAYPFPEIKKNGVINDHFNGKNIVIFYEPGVVSILNSKDISKGEDVGAVTVFNADLNGATLHFDKQEGVFIDRETGSSWNIAGQCFEGKYKGQKLITELHSNHFAFAWFAFYPDSELYDNGNTDDAE